ncbi:SDR family NAD(P)-dependent oxidoreductase [Pseudomonas sp. NA-150]|uniref:SDR family NAD(P)-dependent oxidoreductase n=1 Tax=Pseudomonas sp. NA-150 TaxID=3367525 RepID=UPI0037CC7BF3
MTRNIALITGASRGLGRSAALHLAAQGVDIIGTYHSNLAESQAVISEVEKLGARAVMLQLDVSQSSTFAGFVAEVANTLNTTFSRTTFDFLINNAGVGLHVPFVEVQEAQFDQMVNIHLKGPYFLTQGLLPLIADEGRIVNISSGLARFSMPGLSAYAMMKGGMEVMTRYLALELGPRRIRVNTLAPGAIATDFSGGMVRDNPQVNQNIANATALGRVGQADDIGGAISMLLGEGSGWINGQRIEAAGGVYL